MGGYHTCRFQEIVPLNAGNVLGTEDNGPARKWQALIRKTLNNLPGDGDDFEGSNREKDSFVPRHSLHAMNRSMRMVDITISTPQPILDHRFSVCDRVIFGNKASDDYYYPMVRWDASSDDEDGPNDSFYSQSFSVEDRDRHQGQKRYCLVASKQMVGILLTVWIKSNLRDAVRDLKVSCVGRGLMGYLGNKVRFLPLMMLVILIIRNWQSYDINFSRVQFL